MSRRAKVARRSSKVAVASIVFIVTHMSSRITIAGRSSRVTIAYPLVYASRAAFFRSGIPHPGARPPTASKPPAAHSGPPRVVGSFWCPLVWLVATPGGSLLWRSWPSPPPPPPGPSQPADRPRPVSPLVPFRLFPLAPAARSLVFPAGLCVFASALRFLVRGPRFCL